MWHCIQASLVILLLGNSAALAQVNLGQHQTDTVTPIVFRGGLPYKISVRPFDSGSARLPTLHSYAAAEQDGKWVLLAGRTNGLHGFDRNGIDNFPTQSQNREVWVIDPVSKQSWSRPLDTSEGLTEFQVNALTPTNNQFYQSGDQLYMTGGYGVQAAASDKIKSFGTFDTLSAIHLPGIINWVTNGTGTASDHIRMIQDPLVKVTGGAMYEVGGRTHLVVGQDFDGLYSPQSNGAYTRQVRSFDILDDGTNLSIANESSSTPLPEYRRRDLNVYPTLSPGPEGPGMGGTPEEGLTVLSGVFTQNFGAWTVPIEIDAEGNPTMADPTASDTFKQGFNGYHSAKLGLFSESTGAMHELLFGGISLQTVDPESDQVITDNALPFINDITSVVVDSFGKYSQHYLGEFPKLLDIEGNRLRFGANAEFFLADDIETFGNGVVQLDQVTKETSLGWIYGGLTANGPHTRGHPEVISAASNQIFEVILTPVPEPSCPVLILLGLLSLVKTRSIHWRA